MVIGEKPRRVDSAGSLLYPRAVSEAPAIARSLSQAGLKKIPQDFVVNDRRHKSFNPWLINP
jgi:hypothetical protein